MSGIAKRATQATAFTLVAGAAGGAALLAAEALAARVRRYAVPDLRLAMRTSIGEPSSPLLRLALFGDASALGVGVERVGDTVGGRLAEALANGQNTNLGRRRVELSSVAVVGSRSVDLATQVARALLGDRPDVAVILIGAQDALGIHRPNEAAAHLASAVRRLRDAGVTVVVGTCPDLGAARAFAPPLRQLAGLLARRMARAQVAATFEAGAVAVNLVEHTGAVFRADPGTLNRDGYHPSPDGYRVWAHALLPAVAEAAGAANRR